jgi:acetolactate synthase-1/2/3 large subunit
MSGAQAIVATLQTHGVEMVWGIPGVHTIALYDALHGQNAIRHILARHEQGAGYMANGYARATGKPGVALTITGPGVTNIATPVADAFTDSIPLLVISSALPRDHAGKRTGVLHELKNQIGVMDAVAGWTRAVSYVEEIPEALHDAFRALEWGRPRGAYLEIPLDLFALEADLTIPAPKPAPRCAPPPEIVAAAAALLGQAQRPVILAGAGVTASGAHALLAELAERLQAPVVLGGKSRDVLPDSFPLAIAMVGRSATREVQALTETADVALVVGSKLGEERTGLRPGRLPLPGVLIQIDIDPAEIGRQYPVAIGIAADAGVTLQALLERLPAQPAARVSRVDEVQAARAALRAATLRRYPTEAPFLDAVRQAVPPDGIVVADMTYAGYAAGDYFPTTGPRTFIHSSELCTIGCGLPLALGAKLAHPDRTVVALCGDGGFLLNTGELATAVQEGIGVITIIFNDHAYTAVKSHQKRTLAGRYIATDLVAPDYVALARAFGVMGLRATTPDELAGNIAAARQSGNPTLIEVPLQRQW